MHRQRSAGGIRSSGANWLARSFSILLLALAGHGPGGFHLQADASGPGSILADLTGDGQLETIIWQRIGGETEAGDFFQVRVVDQATRILWASPAVTDPADPLAFGQWHFGVSLPEWAGDLRGDGSRVLIVPAPQSDVSPAWFRVFRWVNQAFEPVFVRALAGAGAPGASFTWTEAPDPMDFWVSRWIGRSAENGLVVEVMSMHPRTGEIRQALAVMLPKGGAFEMVRWIQPPAALQSNPGSETVTRP